MKPCKCGNQCARNARSCPKCGHRFASGLTKFIAWTLGIFFGLGALGAMIGSIGETTPSTVTATPAVPVALAKPLDAAAVAKAQTQAKIQARQDYCKELEGHLLTLGLDATVVAVGPNRDTLRISWKAMSRPVVYNMINGDGMQSQVPLLGFKKVIFTDDGSFSGESAESWMYHWDGQQWHQ
jgi:hypothetical protein